MKIHHWLLPTLLFATPVSNGMAGSITNGVPLTPNLTFFLEKAWGPVTNQFDSDEMISRAFVANGANIVNYRNLPNWSEFYDFKLFDDKGREVPKTKEGLADSKPPSDPKDYSDLHRNFKLQGIPGGKWDDRQLFFPDDMFVISKKGVYELEVRARICVPMTNGVPDTNAMLDFRKTALAHNCGVIESSPVRVKIIKN